MSFLVKHISRLSLAIFSLSVVSVPVTVQAATSFQNMMYNPNKTYKDEKVEINNPTSRCVTAATKASHAQSLKQGEADAKKYNLTTESTGAGGKAYANYRAELDLAWDAMNEPYCGFGAFGTTAAVKSYKKSVDRARNRFLTAMKNLPKEAPVAKATDAVVLEAMVPASTTPVVTETKPEPVKAPAVEVRATVAVEPVKVEPKAVSEENADGILMADLFAGFMK